MSLLVGEWNWEQCSTESWGFACFNVFSGVGLERSILNQLSFPQIYQGGDTQPLSKLQLEWSWEAEDYFPHIPWWQQWWGGTIPARDAPKPPQGHTLHPLSSIIPRE